MSLSDFDELSVAQFQYSIESYHKRNEQIDNEEMHRVRWLACMLLQPHIDKNKEIKPSDLLPLPGDEIIAEPELLTPEQQAERLKLLKPNTNNEQ